MEELMGTIKLFAGNFAPHGYAFCHGQLLPINQNQALFSILGTTYGGDGKTTFALPDLRGRVPVGTGTGDGISSYVNAGNKFGVERNLISVNNIPTLKGSVDLSNLNGNASGSISTTVNATIPVPCSTNADSTTPENNVMAMDLSTPNIYATSAEPGKFMKPLTANLPINFTANLPVSLNGGSVNVSVNKDSGANPLPINNLQPSLGINFIICVEGVYPPRP
ncbi:tail fiber protein [Chryseobacterium sp. PS-8]|uniref:Tail fiber protein n=1 Tax=Chryseobacterium indicum TaxID=2766954 RepID=A0ABS9C399_9FLAO|nr:tail fiber protein [Chryseobacterium sp. PS-8]MCF2218723.1 tail fiber protein [Chryseobacterium sp. PS-8]